MAKNKEVQQEPQVKEEFVTKKEFDNLSGKIETLTEALTLTLKNVKVDEAVEKREELNSINPSEKMIDPEFRVIVDSILGKDFGMDVSYPKGTGTFIFKVMVPKDKSNATDAHWQFYKSDIRSKAIPFSEGLDGVRDYCNKIAKNLGVKLLISKK